MVGFSLPGIGQRFFRYASRCFALRSPNSIRRREFERFIDELKKLPEAVSEFDEALWGSLVEYVTVSKDKTMVFTMISGTEITA